MCISNLSSHVAYTGLLLKHCTGPVKESDVDKQIKNECTGKKSLTGRAEITLYG